MPETVVRAILHGDEKATRIHVRTRNVTIMFSDIRGFTTISESLSQTDLLTLLYMYLSEMTQIVEKHGGVVSEPLQHFRRKTERPARLAALGTRFMLKAWVSYWF